MIKIFTFLSNSILGSLLIAMMTPSFVIDEKVVSAVKVLSINEIRKYL